MTKLSFLQLSRPALYLSGMLAFSVAHAGDITGRVLDSTSKTYLAGVSVQLDGTRNVAITDSEGRFRFHDVPAGGYAVSSDVAGFGNASVQVTAPAKGEVAVELSVGREVVDLGKFVVEGYREGRARALRQKQTQTNISDLVSADAIGNLPDRNVAEAVGRLPGVSLSLEQGEGRYISIRGIEPNLNQVLVDGAVAAAPGGTRLGRAVPLDTLGTGQIAQLEVVKSATPDLDANALGGTLKIKTASAFDRVGRFTSLSITGNNNESTDRNNLEARLSFSDTFGADRKWGLAAAASFDERDYSNHWLQSTWNQRTINGSSVYLPGSFEIKPEEGNLKRRGGNLSLEYRPDDTLQVFLRPNFSTTRRREHTVEAVIAVDNSPARVTLTSPTTGVFAAAGVRPERRDFRSLRDQDLFTISGGFKKIVGDFTIEPLLSYSAAKEDRVYDNVLAFRAAAGVTGPVSFDIGAFDFVRWDVDYTQDTPSDYPLRRTREDSGLVDEDTLTAKIDVTWDARTLFGRPGYIKAGGKYTQRDRLTDLESRRLVPVGNWRLDAIGTMPAVPVYDGRYTSGFLIDHDATFAYIRNNPALTVFDPVESATNSIEDDYDINEFIYAAYAMGSVTLNKLTLLGGVRWEQTDATIRAVEARFAGSTLLGRFPTSGTTRYDQLFPNLQAVYRFTDRLLVRGAITRTIGRPAYEDARPLANFRYDALGAAALDPAFPYSGSLSIGNPNLKPYDAQNYDLSVEWYPRGNTVLSVAVFRKDIDDPIYTYSETQERVVHNGIGLQTLNLTSVRNATQARVNGVELNVYQPFTFLPAPFDGFGLDANITRISSEVAIPTRPGADLPFFRQPQQIENVTLFYEKGRFSGRVAWNRADEQLYTLGSAQLSDVYRLPREQYDVQLRYRFSTNYSITAAVRNLTREPERFSYGIFSLLRTSRLLDRDYSLTLSYNF